MGDIFDLIVIGGGLNGAGIARDAAGRGLSVALFEKDDLAQHGSSASGKIISGDLRYVEDRRLGAARDALIERERLMRIAPHIIWPLEFRIPHAPKQRSGWRVRLDLLLYDHLARREFLGRSRRLRLRDSNLLQPGYRTAFSFTDCWVEDSRLVVLTAMDAAARGASIFTRTKVLAATANDTVWHVETQAGAFSARAVVNATGAWGQDVLSKVLGCKTQHHVRLLKYSYIIVRRLYNETNAFILRTDDKRFIYILPYENDFTLIGASERTFEGDPESLEVDDREIESLCASVNRYLRMPLAPKDVLWTYAGVNPRIEPRKAAKNSPRHRDGIMLLSGPGRAPFVSIIGGDITTYRKRAEQALDRLLPMFGRQPGRSWTANAYLPGGDIQNFPEFKKMLRVRNGHLDVNNLHRLAYSYGTMTEKFVGNDMGEDFGAGLYQSEIDYLVKHEWARTAEDILWRRTKLGLHAPDGTAERVAAYLQTKYGNVLRPAVT